MKLRRGQAMLEYVLVFSAMTVAVVAMAWLVRSAYLAAERTTALVRGDCP